MSLLVRIQTFVLCALLIASLTAAASTSSPIVARVMVFYDHTGGKLATAYQQFPDSFDQLHMLSVWWEEHSAGWKQDDSPAPSGPLFMTLKFKHADGSIDEVSMREGPDETRKAELRSGLRGCGIWPQESICSPNATRRFVQIFTAQDMKALWKASRGNRPESKPIFP
jgi:hypothetical protein